MENKFAFSETKLSGLRSQGRRAQYYDTKCPGLMIRESRAGALSYYYCRYNPEKRQTVKRKIALLSDIPLETARGRVIELNATLRTEGNVSTSKVSAKKNMTLKELYEDFMRTSKLRESTIKTYNDHFYLYCKKYHDTPISIITSDQLTDIYRFAVNANGERPGAKQGAYAVASKTVRLLSVAFNYAIEQNALPYNPVAKLTRTFKHKEQVRERHLSETEVGPFVRECELEFYHYFDNDPLRSYPSHACLLALLTGARRGNILSAHWDEIDMDSQTWTIPADKFKSNREHTIYLSEQALTWLDKLPNREGHVYASPRNAKGHITETTRAIARLASGAEIKPVQFHALRHSFASFAHSAGVDYSVIQEILGHKIQSVTARYIHTNKRVLSEAFQSVADYIDELS